MERRLKHRDLPWSLVLTVLFCKIWGSLTDLLWYRRSYKRKLIRLGKFAFGCILFGIVVGCGSFLANKLSDGAWNAWVLELLNNVKAAI